MELQSVSGSNVPPETLLYYTHELTRSKRKIDEANSAHRLLIKRAKQDGVPTAAILESVADARLDPHERRQKLIDRIRVESVRYPENGEALLTQIEALDTRVADKARTEDSLFSAEQRGYDDGRTGVPIDSCPFEAGSEFAGIWRRFWHEGQRVNAMRLGDNARQASTRRERESPAREPSRAGPSPELPAGEAPRKRRPRRANGEAQPPA